MTNEAGPERQTEQIFFGSENLRQITGYHVVCAAARGDAGDDVEIRRQPKRLPG
jgi:hypothetical protein